MTCQRSEGFWYGTISSISTRACAVWPSGAVCSSGEIVDPVIVANRTYQSPGSESQADSPEKEISLRPLTTAA